MDHLLQLHGYSKLIYPTHLYACRHSCSLNNNAASVIWRRIQIDVDCILPKQCVRTITETNKCTSTELLIAYCLLQFRTDNDLIYWHIIIFYLCPVYMHWYMPFFLVLLLFFSCYNGKPVEYTEDETILFSLHHRQCGKIRRKLIGMFDIRYLLFIQLTV